MDGVYVIIFDICWFISPVINGMGYIVPYIFFLTASAINFDILLFINFVSLVIFLTLIVILILILMCFNYYRFIVITSCNVVSHSEYITKVLRLTCHCISLLFVLYERPDDGLVN